MATNSLTRKRTERFGPSRMGTRRFRRDRITKQWRQTIDGRGPYSGFVGKQVTVSEGHPWPPPRGVFKGDVGGPFSTVRQYAPFRNEGVHFEELRSFSSGADDLQRDVSEHARIPVVITNNSWPTSLQSSEEDLEAMGATAVSRCSPTNEASNLLTAVGEIVKDGFPASASHRNWQERASIARSAGSEYLNQQFGWLPLVNDVLQFADAVRNANSIMSQYERDMGKLVRRRYQFPSELSTDPEVDLGAALFPDGVSSTPGSSAVLPITPGRLVKSVVKQTDTWFSGAFSYGIPLNSTSREGTATLAAKADKLFGISLTPDVLWELAPWSWVVDWFSNVGDVLSNVSDALSQGLVMQYGYIMEHTTHSVTYSVKDLLQGGKPIPLAPIRLVTESKTRVRANPFGFGVSWDGLSPYQLSILAALGISRS